MSPKKERFILKILKYIQQCVISITLINACIFCEYQKDQEVIQITNVGN